MDNNTFMGLLIGALVVLFGLAGTVTGLIIKPIINLNRSIVKLEVSIADLNNSVGSMNARIEKQENTIDDIHKDIRGFEGRISKMEGGKRYE